MTKKIAKVIVYYDDDTSEEISSASIKTSLVNLYNAPVLTSEFSVIRDSNLNSGTYSSYDWNYTYSSSADGAPIMNKYAITSSGNGNVEIQR